MKQQTRAVALHAAYTAVAVGFGLIAIGAAMHVEVLGPVLITILILGYLAVTWKKPPSL